MNKIELFKKFVEYNITKLEVDTAEYIRYARSHANGQMQAYYDMLGYIKSLEQQDS